MLLLSLGDDKHDADDNDDDYDDDNDNDDGNYDDHDDGNFVFFRNKQQSEFTQDTLDNFNQLTALAGGLVNRVTSLVNLGESYIYLSFNCHRYYVSCA